MGHKNTHDTNPARANSWEFKTRDGQPVECEAKFEGEGARHEAQSMHAYFLQMAESTQAKNSIVCDAFSNTSATLTVTDPELSASIQYWIDNYPGLPIDRPRYQMTEVPPEPTKPDGPGKGSDWKAKFLKGGGQQLLPFDRGINDATGRGGRGA